jgi:hypothetical protein
MPTEEDNIKWAVHKDRENTARFEIGLKNLTKGEAEIVLLTLNRLQLYRATGIDAAEVEGTSDAKI